MVCLTALEVRISSNGFHSKTFFLACLAKLLILRRARQSVAMWYVVPVQSTDCSSLKGNFQTWGGGSDSYFEYLIKYARLSNTNDNSYTDSWLTAVQSSIDTLAKVTISHVAKQTLFSFWLIQRSTVGNWLYLADYDGSQVRHVGSHLACFYGGNWILGEYWAT